jgi:hypothetical protein
MRMLLGLLLVMGTVQSGRAGVISAVADYQLGNIDYLLGIVTGDLSGNFDLSGQGLQFITQSQIFLSPLYTPSQDINLQFLSLIPNEMMLSPLSQVTALDSGFPFTPSGDSGFVASALRNRMFAYDLQLQADVQGLQVTVAPIPDAITSINGVLYYQGQGIIYSIDLATGVGTQVAAPDTYVTGPTTLAAGPGGKLYTIGQAIGNEGSCTDGQWCVIGIDPSDGSLVSGFPLGFDASTSVLTIGADGTFYLATGNGQGYGFTGAGLEFATLSSAAVNPEISGGHTLLTLDGEGHLYMADAATGLHVFDVGTPEPGAAGLTALGVLLLSALPGIRRRRAANKDFSS